MARSGSRHQYKYTRSVVRVPSQPWSVDAGPEVIERAVAVADGERVRIAPAT